MTGENMNTIKCVVWDLDETIWTGILSENDKLTLREGISDLIESLDSRGILNSIASRNNFDDAVSTLESFSLRDYFVYPQINWNSKSEAIEAIKTSLNIGYNTIAFIDDQDFELAEVKSVHPEVTCIHANDIRTLLQNEKFITSISTEEGKSRRLMYQTDEERSKEETKFANNIEFLQSLNMKLSIKLATENDLNRIHELTVRTNQLNATGYTYSYEELKALLKSPSHHIYVAELEDKFGSYGKIGVTLLETSGTSLTIKLLLISCRVISRGIGTTLISFIINKGISASKRTLAEFLPTSRNNLMYITYKFANFKEISKIGNLGVLLEYYGPSSPIKYAPYITLET